MTELNLNKFAVKLYKKLSDGADENLFISPFSISTALAMCYIGAKENTAAQLKQVLGFENLDNEAVLRLSAELMTDLNKIVSVELNVANKIYPMTGFEVKKDFSDALIKNFQTEVQSLDFAKNVEAANTINAWVEQKTKDKIKNLVSSDALNDLTRLVLVNAIYFKGNWANQFDKSQTRKEAFFLRDGSSKQVDMMRLTGEKFRYASQPAGLPVETCELPYAGNRVSMTIILPNRGVDFKTIENSLDDVKLRSLVFEKNRSEVNVYIPKFSLEHSRELSKNVSELGAPDAFDRDKANFKGISDITSLFISKVIHKAFVDVNEEGTEAAAATAIVMNTFCMVMDPQPPVDFKCDRPFLFAIHDNFSGSVLFLGKYAKP